MTNERKRKKRGDKRRREVDVKGRVRGGEGLHLQRFRALKARGQGQ